MTHHLHILFCHTTPNDFFGYSTFPKKLFATLHPKVFSPPAFWIFFANRHHKILCNPSLGAILFCYLTFHKIFCHTSWKIFFSPRNLWHSILKLFVLPYPQFFATPPKTCFTHPKHFLSPTFQNILGNPLRNISVNLTQMFQLSLSFRVTLISCMYKGSQKHVQFLKFSLIRKEIRSIQGIS